MSVIRLAITAENGFFKFFRNGREFFFFFVLFSKVVALLDPNHPKRETDAFTAEMVRRYFRTTPPYVFFIRYLELSTRKSRFAATERW